MRMFIPPHTPRHNLPILNFGKAASPGLHNASGTQTGNFRNKAGIAGGEKLCAEIKYVSSTAPVGQAAAGATRLVKKGDALGCG
ncbi:hypothetical protein Aam_001_017 [Acidocella aminolytica 101 = DSM 11237]|uniref:Uncharacterized protein n=1 Tax=Acidocella aminolytica 101 = DSM 11237 TaxID=1120923 RepID=A0A0D6P9Z1_9PROT|nr:hypothetical protein Aam_001_017 [Acidocella aminolytica 101 = DSM 11237]